MTRWNTTVFVAKRWNTTLFVAKFINTALFVEKSWLRVKSQKKWQIGNYHLFTMILQCKYVDKYGRLDVVEEEEFRSSPDQNVVSDCKIDIRM